MRTPTLVCLAALLLTALPSHAELSEVETKYLIRFTTLTGIAPSHIPEHAFSGEYMGALRLTKDEHLQRRYILDNLPRLIRDLLEDLEKNRTPVGKSEYREATPEERGEMSEKFEECMKLLEKLDSGRHPKLYQEYRDTYTAAYAKRYRKDAAPPAEPKK
jgi:hypothetical protein